MAIGMHEIDQKKLQAYEKGVAADKLLAMGRMKEAQLMMAEAASLDGAYAVRAELLGRPDGRRPRIEATVRKILVPFLVEAGFAIADNGPWTAGKMLNRRRGDCRHMILIGREKFGHMLGVMAMRQREGGKSEYFDWCSACIRSGGLAYATQTELEAVCARWCDLIALHLFPWLDTSDTFLCDNIRS